MVIKVKGPTNVFGDNKSVLDNTSKPDLALMKRSNYIAYHHVCEGSTRDEWCVAYISTDDNQADLMKKCLPYGTERVKHSHNLLY